MATSLKPTSTYLDESVKCSACKVYVSRDERYIHYRSDWHLCNVKRKCIGIEPVEFDEFQGKSTLDANDTNTASTNHSDDNNNNELDQLLNYKCTLCSKSFKSIQQCQSHINTKKHKNEFIKYHKNQRNKQQEQHNPFKLIPLLKLTPMKCVKGNPFISITPRVTYKKKQKAVQTNKNKYNDDVINNFRHKPKNITKKTNKMQRQINKKQKKYNIHHKDPENDDDKRKQLIISHNYNKNVNLQLRKTKTWKTKQELLWYGYIRIYCNNYNSFSYDVVRLMVSYFNHTFKWSFDCSKLIQMSYVGIKFNIKTFIINDAVLECSFYPLGSYKKKSGCYYPQIHIEIKSKRKEMKNVTIYYNVNNKHIIWKGKFTYSKGTDLLISPQYLIKKFKKMNNYNVLSWAGLQKYSDDILKLNICIDLLCIEYWNKYNLFNYYKNCYLNKILNYKWNIVNTKLRYSRILESDVFGCWYLILDSCELFLRLIQLPKNIVKVYIKYNIVLSNDVSIGITDLKHDGDAYFSLQNRKSAIKSLGRSYTHNGYSMFNYNYINFLLKVDKIYGYISNKSDKVELISEEQWQVYRVI